MSDKYLYKIVSRYCNDTVPAQIIMQTVNESKELHDQGKLTFNEECIYDWMRGIKRKNGAIIGKSSSEATEPEDWELINEGICGDEVRDEYEEEL